MKQMVPLSKRSKKEQRAYYTQQRGSWNGLSPVTRKPENSRAYNRKKARKWKDDSMTVPFSYTFSPQYT